MKSIQLFIILIIGLFFSCGNLVDDLNTDPNNPTEVPLGTVLTSAQVASILVHEGDATIKAGLWTDYFTGSARQFVGFDNYIISSQDFDLQWENLYNGVVRNCKLIIEEAEEKGNLVIAGIAKVLLAHSIGMATSAWGDIPFSEAGLNEFSDPAYDSQQALFSSIQNLLNEAINNFGTGTGVPTEGSDIFFNGNSQYWIEVAYTLKSRYFLLTGEYENAYRAALSGINVPENSMLAPHTSSQGAQNLYYQFNAGQRFGDITSENTFIESLLHPSSHTYRGNSKTNETARYAYYITKVDNIPYPNFSDGYFAEDRDFPMVTYEENLLNLAESGLRSGDFNTGLTSLNKYRQYMNSGGYIDEAFFGLGLSYEDYVVEDFQTGGIENTDGLTLDEALLREILEERYVTFYAQFLGFDDLRRTLDENVVKVPLIPSIGSQHAQ